MPKNLGGAAIRMCNRQKKTKEKIRTDTLIRTNSRLDALKKGSGGSAANTSLSTCWFSGPEIRTIPWDTLLTFTASIHCQTTQNYPRKSQICGLRQTTKEHLESEYNNTAPTFLTKNIAVDPLSYSIYTQKIVYHYFFFRYMPSTSSSVHHPSSSMSTKCPIPESN